MISNERSGPRHRRVLIYGESGQGKSTWASQCPDPVFIDLEDGLAEIQPPPSRTQYISRFEDFGPALREASEAACGTVVLDSASALERLLHQDVCMRNGVSGIAEIDYGRGYEQAAVLFGKILDYLGEWRARRHVIFIAHEAIAKYTPPGEEAYDRFQPAIHKTILRMLTHWCDDVLRLYQPTVTRSSSEGFGRDRTIAVASSARKLLTSGNAFAVAKNRLGVDGDIDPQDFFSFLTMNEKELQHV